MKFSVIDIETTGLNPEIDRITEISVVAMHDFNVVNTHHWLIKSDKEIPGHIRVLTGINQELLENGFLFQDVAQDLLDLFDNTVLVAHQAHFDISFLKTEFKRVGVQFRPNSVCTLNMARKLVPTLRGYTLAHLCRYMGIVNHQPHRATGDATATAEILKGLLGLGGFDYIKSLIKCKLPVENRPVHVPDSDWDNLPEYTGVYYLCDSAGRILYIGKALNIKKRVRQHFRGQGARAVELRKTVHVIRYENTGSYVMASLVEDKEIRWSWPMWNVSQKEHVIRYGIQIYTDRNGRKQLRAARLGRQTIAIIEFFTLWQARNWLYKILETYGLNSSWCGFDREISGEVGKQKHNQGVDNLLADLDVPSGSFICRLKGRNDDEWGGLIFEDGNYVGYVFYPKTVFEYDNEEFKKNIIPQNLNSTLSGLIKGFLNGGMDTFEQILI